MAPLFNVLATVDVLSEQYLHLIIESYLSFFEKQTPKKQSKINLILFSRRYSTYQYNGNALSDLGLNITVICTTNEQETNAVFKAASILLLPILETPESIVKELLICGVPILCHQKSIIRKHIDKQFMLVAGDKNEADYNSSHAVEDYANLLKILYFDSSVQKLLKKKADKKYRRKVTNGGKLIGRLKFDSVTKPIVVYTP